MDGCVQPHLWNAALDEAVDILVLFFMVCGAPFSFCTREVSGLAKALKGYEHADRIVASNTTPSHSASGDVAGGGWEKQLCAINLYNYINLV